MSDRLLFNDDGKTLDEIVFTGMMHLEQEDDDAYYLAVYQGDGPNAPYALFNLYAEPYIAEDEDGNTAVKVRLTVSERDMGMRFPLVQRHKTEAEWDEDQRFLAAIDGAPKSVRKYDPNDWYVTLSRTDSRANDPEEGSDRAQEG